MEAACKGGVLAYRVMSMTGQSSRYLPHFDGLRGVAILGFLFHCISPAFPSDGLAWSGLFWDFSAMEWWHWVVLPLNYGGTRVAMFFVLSGFCIHLSHRRARQPTWNSFANRRFFRIFPPYLVALCLFLFVWPWGTVATREPLLGTAVSHALAGSPQLSSGDLVRHQRILLVARRGSAALRSIPGASLPEKTL